MAEKVTLEDRYGIRIENGIVSGRPTISDYRVPVFVVVGRFEAGDSVANIADDLEIKECEVTSAIRYALRIGKENL